MPSFRNNGIKFNTARLTGDEVLGIVGHTATRLAEVQGEMAHIVGYAVEQGLLEVDQLPQPELPYAPDEAS